jgi:hypothetical protein
VDRVREPRAVHRVHEREAADVLHLVTLQVPDQVPAHRNGHLLHLAEGLLDLVLADVPQPRVPRGLHRLGAVRLRDRDDRDVLPVPAAGDRGSNALAYLPHPRGKVGKEHNTKF